eukprot:CAMPEP_0172683538 /NCGR_PEP_ID=MMETSP1074-20121228/18929_1 /TAXON_ID=2916 /ORGANISM="Ceratium fusus, Strain PA161109" /LENGTH=88 /DNA_ID=CAMNT_0013502397 /DNA_START=119 /DNA_END=385 /DNA_ORIENTATION=+
MRLDVRPPPSWRLPLSSIYFMQMQVHRPDLRRGRSVWHIPLWEPNHLADEALPAQPAGAGPVATPARWPQGDNPRSPGAFHSCCLQPD